MNPITANGVICTPCKSKSLNQMRPKTFGTARYVISLK